MQVKVRLYRPHDIDLIIMHQSMSYKLGAEMKRCLIAYASGDVYEPPVFNFDNENKVYLKSYQFNIVFNNENAKDAAAIDVLQQIKPGYRCSFLKALFRSNILYLPLLAYIDENTKLVSNYQNQKWKLKNELECSKNQKQETDIKIMDSNNDAKEDNAKIEQNIETNDNSEFDALFDALSSI